MGQGNSGLKVLIASKPAIAFAPIIEIEEPCASNGFKVRSTFESFFGSFFSKKEQSHPVQKEKNVYLSGVKFGI
ncbi:hypothetical protein [uncultured Rikenella sp.]|uniref:hypothetical protein n=1 Tax=uncultured Rikenella sp. TaxID=368003 RepID=UPI002628253F|nr:hypothetical protein [uncultured Rikenella sp.]